MGQRNLETKSRMKNSKDPLMGAPGHATSPGALEPKLEHAHSEEIDSAEDVGTVESLLSRLGGMFGQENVDKLKTALVSNSRDAEEKIMQFIRTATASLPHDFKLPSMSAIKRYPVVSASAVAAGVPGCQKFF